jgi:hypothetical protein
MTCPAKAKKNQTKTTDAGDAKQRTTKEGTSAPTAEQTTDPNHQKNREKQQKTA